MIAFKGPKHQGGWVIIAGAVAGIAGNVLSQKSADKQQKVKYEDSRDLSNLNFEQQNWTKQQDRKWELEDYATKQNYKEDAIAGFRQYAPANVADPNGEWQAPPARTTVDTTGLAQTDANGQPLIYDPRTGKPVFANSQVPQGTLPQVGA